MSEPTPQREDGVTDVPAERLLGRARDRLDVGDLDGAADALGEVGERLGERPRPDLLGRAMWLAAIVALRQGRAEDFHAHAAAAVDTLVAAGDRAAADVTWRAWHDIADRMQAMRTVAQEGPPGLLAVLVHHLERLLARRRGALGWPDIDRDRAQLAELLALPADDTGAAQPLARMIRALELDHVDAVLVGALAALELAPELAGSIRALDGDARADGVSAGLVAELGFAHPAGRQRAIERLGPSAPLLRYRVVRLCADGTPAARRVALEPAVLWFLRGTPLPARPLPAGLTAHALAPDRIPVDPTLRPACAGLTRALRSPRSAVVLVCGRQGAGKGTVTLAAAADSGRPTLVLNPDGSEPAAAREAVRDALLHGAVLHVRPARAGGEPRWSELAREPGLRLVVGVTPERRSSVLEAVRRARSDVAVLDLPALEGSEQAAAWQRCLEAMSLRVPWGAVEARLCRPGLVIGDLVETITEALARSDLDGRPIDAVALARCLDDRLQVELAAVSEILAAQAAGAVPPAVAAWVEELAAAEEHGQTTVNAWGEVDRSHRPRRLVAHLIGGTSRHHAAVARRLAARRGRMACRVDVSALSPERLEAVLDASGRAGAVLLLASADAFAAVSSSPVVTALGAALDQGRVTVLLGSERAGALPLSLASRVDFELDLAELGKEAS